MSKSAKKTESRMNLLNVFFSIPFLSRYWQFQTLTSQQMQIQFTFKEFENLSVEERRFLTNWATQYFFVHYCLFTNNLTSMLRFQIISHYFKKLNKFFKRYIIINDDFRNIRTIDLFILLLFMRACAYVGLILTLGRVYVAIDLFILNIVWCACVSSNSSSGED